MLERGGSVRPFHDEDRSRELTCAISSVRNVSDSTDLAACLQRLFQASGNTPEYVKNYGKEETDVECWPFSGLAVFLDEIAHVDERDNFFAAVLPFVVWLASRAPELIPEEGIPVGTQQNETTIILDRKLIASLLAMGFLCAFPPVPDRTRTINFANFYAYFHREDYRCTQAAKLRCFIHYFERLKTDWERIDGHVTLSRQVIRTPSIPTLEDWLVCPLPLCPIIVDNEKAIEDSGSHTLQVDFANRYIGGGVLGGGHVQEEIRFCASPELVISQLCMEAMDPNEAIIIKGSERFSSYRGYGKTFQFGGDFQDESEKDGDGNFQTSVVAIDAKSFRNSNVQSQYRDESVLRELNKALAGFHNPQAAERNLLQNGAEREPRDDHVNGRSVQSEDKGAFDALLNSAVDKTFNDIARTTRNTEEGDIFIKAMKKSVLEAFQETPQKASAYYERFLSPSTPKCMRINLSGQSSPLVPSTPPPSPFAEGMGRGCSFEIPSVSPSQLLNGDEGERLLCSSFADALYESLLTCVRKTSSIAGSIAVAATSPVKAALVTKEVFAKSPKDIGSPVRGGDDLASFLSRTLREGRVQLNGKHSSAKGFAQDLANLFRGSSRAKRADENGAGLPDVRKNLSRKFERVECSAEEPPSTCLYSGLEEFAAEISKSVLDAAICAFVGVDRTDTGGDSIPTVNDEGSATAECAVADSLIERVLFAALNDAAREMAGCPVEFESGDESRSESSGSDSELQELSDETSHERSSSPASESTIDLENVEDVQEEVHTLADELSENLLRSGMVDAVDHILKEQKTNKDLLGFQEKTEVIPSTADSPAETSTQLADETGTPAGSFLEFADNLCETTLTAGIQIAQAHLRLHQSEAVVRAVATGNWGCGVFRGDPELKAVVQWLAASAAGAPAFIHHTFGDRRLSPLFKVLSTLRSRDHKVCDVIRGVLRFRERMLTSSDEDCRPKLSSALLESDQTTS